MQPRYGSEREAGGSTVQFVRLPPAPQAADLAVWQPWGWGMARRFAAGTKFDLELDLGSGGAWMESLGPLPPAAQLDLQSWLQAQMRDRIAREVGRGILPPWCAQLPLPTPRVANAIGARLLR